MVQKCPKCGNSGFEAYELIKCKSCGYVVKGFDYVSKSKWRLKITYNPKENKILLLGDKAGLEFLANCCLSVIGKYDPSGHIHLEWQNNNLVEGSTETILEFSDDPANY